MTKKFVFFVSYIILYLCNYCISQKQNVIWCFGDSAGIDFNNLTIPTPIATGGDGRGNCTSIADSNGNLLFYATENSNSDAVIYNKNHTLMANTSGMPSDGYFAGMVIIPKPGSDSLYYLFYRGNPNNVDTFYRAIIDMSQNNGLGAVIEKNKVIQPISFADCMTAVQHGNGRDWWLINKYFTYPFTHHNRFFTYLIKPDTIMPATIQDFNDMTDGYFQKICWHPSFNKFMLISIVGYMAEFDFDRCTGAISLNRIIFPAQLSNYNRIFWEGAYSPNGNVFYVSRNSYGGNFGNYNYLLQYDLTATNIPASCDTLNYTTYPHEDCGAVRLAPDGKIYYAHAYLSTSAISYPYQDTMRNYINENLGVVNNPDVVGAGCNFAPFSFHLGGKRTYWGLPNNPDYSLGRLVGSPCDTLQWSSSPPAPQRGELIRLSPNPFSSKINIELIDFKNENWQLKIFDAMGKEILFQKITKEKTEIDLRKINNGMYYVMVYDGKNIFTRKIIKE